MNTIYHTYPSGITAEKEVSNHPDQKFPIGTEVYIIPISDKSMLHFDCDVITTVKYTYGQMFGDNTGGHTSYSTAIASWYEEHQIVATNGRSIEQCRSDLINDIGSSYEDLLNSRSDSISRCTIRKMMQSASKRVMDNLASEFTDHLKGKENLK